MNSYHVGISIVNFKTAELVVQCMAALASQKTRAKVSVCIVDNASGDGSLDVLTREACKLEYCDWVTVIDGEVNGGFSFGNNVAAKHFKKLEITHFWMLNSDAIPKQGALDELLKVLDDYPNCAVAGSRLQDEDGTPQIAAFNFPSPFGEFVNTSHLNVVNKFFQSKVIAISLPLVVADVDWVAGASMLVKWPAFVCAGFMDEGYFLYFEEVDLCLAIRRAGHQVKYVPNSRVFHHVGASTGISDLRQKSPRRPTYWFESRRRFFIKNYGPISAVVADFFWLTGYGIGVLKRLIKGEKNLDPPLFAYDFICQSTFFKGWKI